jgi:hypothetical protein
MMNYQYKSASSREAQLLYFREYIKSFKPGSKEFVKLDQGIKALERLNQ